MVEKELEPHEFFEQGVGKHEGDSFSTFNFISRSTYEKWGRKPASDETPSGTGLINPIQRLDRIFDWFLLHNPSWAIAIIQRYTLKLRLFRERHSLQPLSPSEYRSRLSKVIAENSDVITSLVSGAPLSVVKKEIAEYQRELDELVIRLELSESGSMALTPSISSEVKR